MAGSGAVPGPGSHRPGAAFLNTAVGWGEVRITEANAATAFAPARRAWSHADDIQRPGEQIALSAASVQSFWRVVVVYIAAHSEREHLADLSRDL